jgi:hypothetical protein
MPGFSTSLANGVINATLRGQAFPTVRTTYFALFTTDPTDAFTNGTEVNAAWYERQPAGAFAAPNNGVTYNSTRVQFPPVAGANVTVTHVGIVEGNSPTDPTSTLLYSQALSVPKVLSANDVFVVDSETVSGDWTLTLL